MGSVYTKFMNAGDGVCDDVNNNAGCNWDKGDCCGATKTYKAPYWYILIATL